MALSGWSGGFEPGGDGGDDEAAESGVELVRSCTEIFFIGSLSMFTSGSAVLDVTVLPPGEAFGIGHLGFALVDGLGESADGTFAALGERSGVRVHDCVSVGASVACAHDDAFARGESASEVVKRKSRLNFSHSMI